MQKIYGKIDAGRLKVKQTVSAGERASISRFVSSCWIAMIIIPCAKSLQIHRIGKEISITGRKFHNLRSL